MAVGGGAGHSDQYVPIGSMTHRYLHGFRCWSRLRASAQPLMVTGAMDINTFPGYGRTTDPYMAINCSAGLVNINATSGCSSHSDWHMFQFPTWLQTKNQNLGICMPFDEIQAIDANTDLGCSRT